MSSNHNFFYLIEKIEIQALIAQFNFLELAICFYLKKNQTSMPYLYNIIFEKIVEVVNLRGVSSKNQ